MIELRPNWVSKLVKFSPASIDCLTRNVPVEDAYLHGGICKGLLCVQTSAERITYFQRKLFEIGSVDTTLFRFEMLVVIEDGTIGWLVRGATLEVFSNKDGQRLAAWCFGFALKDQQTVITAVTEYTYENSVKLLVATATASTGSCLLSVFDVKTSKVLKCIEVPYQVR